MDQTTLLTLVLALPAAGAVIIGLFGRRLGAASGWIATGAVFGALLAGLGPALTALDGGFIRTDLWQFFQTGELRVPVAFSLDRLSAVMLFVVLGVGSLIHLFSIGYMSHDPGRRRFFAYLNMFITFMLILILGDNLFMLFVGWEGVGLASYCLIGFWFEREAPRRAAIKAFITNRVGDFSFMIGLLLLATMTGSASFDAIAGAVREGSATGFATVFSIAGFSMNWVELTALLLFIGACGKSAQFPLHVWLPDAMEGPTPVSALIHAATMVTAGIYMVVRLSPLFAAAPFVQDIMVTIAVITALGAAFAALTQFDLKRILAYSTISQLGFMMAAAAVIGSGAAIFHLATHAVFKALLFLAAGSVMHGLSGELDIRKMGGLIKRMPYTSWTLIVGAAGLAGVIFFAGFYSKDAILIAVGKEHKIHALLLYVAALVTAFYSTRMVVVALLGKERLEPEVAEHVHEGGLVMTIPLVLLAVGTLIVGQLPISDVIEGPHEAAHHGLVFWASVIGPLLMIAAGWFYYRDRVPQTSPIADFARDGFRLDDLYEKTILSPLRSAAEGVKLYIDRAIIDSFAHGFAHTVGFMGESMRVLQTGNLGAYLSWMFVGVLFITWVVMG